MGALVGALDAVLFLRSLPGREGKHPTEKDMGKFSHRGIPPDQTIGTLYANSLGTKT